MHETTTACSMEASTTHISSMCKSAQGQAAHSSYMYIQPTAKEHRAEACARDSSNLVQTPPLSSVAAAVSPQRYMHETGGKRRGCCWATATNAHQTGEANKGMKRDEEVEAEETKQGARGEEEEYSSDSLCVVGWWVGECLTAHHYQHPSLLRLAPSSALHPPPHS